jgi:hypothetical protein
MVVGSPFLAMVGYKQYCNGKNSENWPTTTAKVTHFSIQQKRRRLRVWYEPNIEYHYRVNGQEYTGRRISFVISPNGSESAAQQIGAKYPVNSTPKVFYDPTNPSSCTLETGTNTAGILLMVSVVIFMPIAGVGIVWKHRKPRLA